MTVDEADSQTFDAVLVLYLACSKLPDGELDEAEARRILQLTAKHTAGLAHGYAHRAIADAAAGLSAATSPRAKLDMVVTAAEHLAERLSDEAKRAVLAELESIAAANGQVTDQEREFVAATAMTLGLSVE